MSMPCLSISSASLRTSIDTSSPRRVIRQRRGPSLVLLVNARLKPALPVRPKAGQALVVIGSAATPATPQAIDNYYIHADNNSEPFGNNAATTFTLNLKFPGQQWDKETGLHYNYFRDYAPGLGRYVQSDPIGLAGGISTYLYVEGDPVRYTDPTGEIIPAVAIGGAMLFGGVLDLGVQLYKNGGNFDCVDWGDVAISAVASASLGGRFGYKATLEGLKPVAQKLTKEGAYALRSQVRSDYRLFKPIKDLLSRRDVPIEKVSDPIASFARSNWKYDLGLTGFSAATLGYTIGTSTAGGKCGCTE